ncbi:putative ABC transporter ATP-binding protein YheS [Luteitalea pratensis]|uniref:Putative ABC transporter ATP-binding protein YheS n=1 Tax=Luteitalea pratensis TaxID=1855912 RepID=A0A143PWP1_LUTPR|nr:ABC-F family ATP-binding cassette domain-containing protein [Luteitalea pratensis]AMY12209.1 putative ABC transporter ATP-binding protein YheS [Luteitalea pratensis]
MLQLVGIRKAFADRVLLDDVTWQLNARDRVGLCGPNGAGKTTLLRILARLDEPDAGQLVTPSDLTIGYLPQDGLEYGGRALVDEARQAFGPLLALKEELHRLEDQLADTTLDDAAHGAVLMRYSEGQEDFRRLDGYTMDLRVATVLRGLGFEEDDMQKPTETFSGGWQMRIALAKLLLQRPALLLLDEPTNHLDLDARNWLEAYLTEYPGAVMLVSHDRYFLDAVVTRIADLSLRTITDYQGNYSYYLREHEARMERLRTMKREQDEEVARIKMFIDRFRYKATKAAQVQSRIKALEKVVPIDVPPERKQVHFTFPECTRSGRTVLELSHAGKRYAEKVIFRDLSLLIERGDRVALVGPNGAGKSTLMRMLSGAEAPDTGIRTEGHQVVVQYFAQDEANRLDPTRTVYETLADGSPNHMVPAIRNILGGFLFAGDDVYKKAGVLSGGERTRLAVARMLLRPANLLLLDEPTNHLDLDSKDVLLESLEGFTGTLILVSHDRYFVDRLATKIIAVGHGEALVYPGTYEEFRWSQEQRAATAAASNVPKTPAPVPKSPAPAKSPVQRQAPRADTNPGATVSPAGRSVTATQATPSEAAPVVSAPDRDERKRVEAEQRRLRRAWQTHQERVGRVESRIAECEREIKSLEEAMSGVGFYDDPVASKPIIDRHQALMWEVGDRMAEWEALLEAAPPAP